MTTVTEAALAVLVLVLHRRRGRRWAWPEDWHERMAAVDSDIDRIDSLRAITATVIDRAMRE